MDNNNYKNTVRNLTRLIITNKQKMIREEDLKNLCSENLDFNELIKEIYINLKNVGFELISSTFLEQKYYILTAEGKDDKITPSQYGTLALILALSQEIDENINLEELKEMFSEVWASDVKNLLENDYIRKIKIDNSEIIRITPLGKATLKNIISDLNLKSLIAAVKNKEKNNNETNK
jgi:hypothetical protein